MVTADKDSQTLFGNVSMTNSAAYEQELSAGGSLHVHARQLAGSHRTDRRRVHRQPHPWRRRGTDQVSFSLTVDGQPVPVYVGWIQPGLESVSMDLPMLPHTSDTAGISLTVSEPGSSDTFDVTNESVVADQDAWIVPVQTDSYRGGQQPAVLDLVRGDDSGTPQAPGQAQDIYFTLEYGGYTAGLVNSDGSITPIDPNAAYADFGITVAGQNGGVTYDPNTGLFKTTIPANQSSVELNFIPTNLFGPAGVNPILYQVDLQGTATDPNTQIGFDFNAPQTNPATGAATQPYSNLTQHGLLVTGPEPASPEALQSLIADLSNPDPQVRQNAIATLGALCGSSADFYSDLLSYLNQATDPNTQTELESLLNNDFPLSPVINQNENTLSISLPSWIPSGNDIWYRIDVDGRSWISCGMWGGETLSDEYDTPAGETTGLPEIELLPRWIGNYTITIIVTAYGPNGPNDAPIQTITQNVVVTVVNT